MTTPTRPGEQGSDIPGPFDARETRDPAEREAAQFAALASLLDRAKQSVPAYVDTLADIDPAAVTDREGLAALPLVRKSDLPERQSRHPPFGGMTGTATSALARIFASPGPIYDPEAHRTDYWRTARALHATGIRPGDIVQNCFSYHFTPAGSMFETGAHALGCAVIPAGVGNTELQARALNDLGPRAYVGTPDFLKTILEKVDELGLDASSLTRAHVSGGPLFPALRSFYQGRGVTCLQSYGTADIGLIAYETLGPDGINPGLVVDEDVIVEIVRPGTGDPVPAGEVGELVVTTLNPDYPLIRFATGDMSAVLDAPSPCGRTNMRIKGWMGRADQTTKVKGLFVHPSQVAQVQRRHPELARVRLVVSGGSGPDVMTLKAALKDAGAQDTALAGNIAATLQSVTNLRGTVEIVPLDALPNDGKMIDDARSYGARSDDAGS
ncbi:AMP-binding protein [Fodinicurvata sp. EGI_FJ10296]|uniref:phenylacetate--CoA ligase family protein n=1 Tax=Fodinicurvata sp. EGI_FJ10296 TaxID=3231908 RepID=UPI003454747C